MAHHAVADALARWREADRRASALAPDAPEYREALREVDRLRRAYIALIEGPGAEPTDLSNAPLDRRER